MAAALEKDIFIYEAPKLFSSIETLVLIKKQIISHGNSITKVFWSPDSRFFLSTGSDCIVKMTNLFSLPGWTPTSFIGHRTKILSAFFSDDMKHAYTLSKDAMLYIWEWKTDFVSNEFKNQQNYQSFKAGKKLCLPGNKSITTKLDDDPEIAELGKEENYDEDTMKFYSEFEKGVDKGRWILSTKKQFYQEGAWLKSALYFAKENLLILGYQNGVFGLYRCDGVEFDNLQVFSVAQEKISYLTVNGNGAWIAFACKKSSQ